MFSDLITIKFKRTEESEYERGIMIMGNDAPTGKFGYHGNAKEKTIIVDEKMEVLDTVFNYIEDKNIKLNIRFINFT